MNQLKQHYIGFMFNQEKDVLVLRIRDLTSNESWNIFSKKTNVIDGQDDVIDWERFFELVLNNYQCVVDVDYKNPVQGVEMDNATPFKSDDLISKFEKNEWRVFGDILHLFILDGEIKPTFENDEIKIGKTAVEVLSKFKDDEK